MRRHVHRYAHAHGARFGSRGPSCDRARNGLEFWRTWSRSWRCSRSMIPTWSWRGRFPPGAYSSLPSYVRAAERRRITERGIVNPGGGTRELSFIVPTRNGAATIGAALEAIGARLCSGNEIIVVENGSTDATRTIVNGIREAWDHEAELVVTTSPPGLGHALRTGVLASEGRRLLLSADDLPFGFSDLERFRNLPATSSLRSARRRIPRRSCIVHPAGEPSRGCFASCVRHCCTLRWGIAKVPSGLTVRGGGRSQA